MLYSTILTIHIATAVGLLVLVFYTDSKAALWLIGKTETLSHKTLTRIHKLVYAGLTIMLCTGLYMFWPVQSYLLATPAFQIKMAFVFFLLVNSVFISKHLHIATTHSFASLPNKDKAMLLISGGVSFCSWVGAVIAATQLGL